MGLFGITLDGAQLLLGELERQQRRGWLRSRHGTREVSGGRPFEPGAAH